MTARKPKKRRPPIPTAWDSLVATLRATDDLPPKLAELVAKVPTDGTEAPPDLRLRVADAAMTLARWRSPSEWSSRVAGAAARLSDEALRSDVEYATLNDAADEADRMVWTPPPDPAPSN